MNAIIRNIPNYITLSNLCCGILSIIFTLNNQLDLGALFIFLGVFLIAPKYGYISARLKIRQAYKRIENGF